MALQVRIYVVNVYMVLCILIKLCTISFSVAPMDYSQNTPVTLEFEKCDMTQCHYISIVDDDVPESNEIFYVTLEGTTDLDRDEAVLDPVNGIIQIFDHEKRSKYASLWACKHRVFHEYLYFDIQLR